ncbi:MAG: L-threonylcarbamoyladenylate synthase [Bacteroidetes bacterium]|nr:L-threonylcarbamoyladenylate synthase [Bacteroidota bacterium]
MNHLEEAAGLLKQGELVAIPTETVYGLAANAFNEEAVLKIYKTKNRPHFNPLIIHSNSVERFEEWGIFLPEFALKLASHFSPGPITFVVPTSNKIPDMVTAGHNSVAIRIPNHPITLELLSMLDFPLAAPSANPSTFVSPTSASHVKQQLGNKIKCILDGGNCEVGIESTILSFLENTPRILRYGGLAKEQIEKILGIKVNVPQVNGDTSKIIAPGMIERHYAPNKKLIVSSDFEKEIMNHQRMTIGSISFSTNYKNIDYKNQFILSESGNLDEAARHLFSALRSLNELNIDIILAENFPDEGLGIAINDRLKRASVQ